jgi:hypothetical protein
MDSLCGYFSIILCALRCESLSTGVWMPGRRRHPWRNPLRWKPRWKSTMQGRQRGEIGRKFTIDG